MEKLEVLIATMNQQDFSLVDKMKIESNAIIANQTNFCEFNEMKNKAGIVKMISTETKGVGLNRNIALAYSESEYLLIADDDEVLYPNYEEKIIKAFKEVPDADVLIFNINTISDSKVSRRTNETVKRIRFYNIFNYGAVRIAIKKSSFLRANVCFTQLFGGGTQYSAGEDSLFLKKCLFSGMKIYAYPLCIADVYQFQSSWFQGYNEKYFFDKGCWCAATFPKLKLIMCILFTLKTYEKCDVSKGKALRLAIFGCYGFNKGQCYNDFEK